MGIDVVRIIILQRVSVVVVKRHVRTVFAGNRERCAARSVPISYDRLVWSGPRTTATAGVYGSAKSRGDYRSSRSG